MITAAMLSIDILKTMGPLLEKKAIDAKRTPIAIEKTSPHSVVFLE